MQSQTRLLTVFCALGMLCARAADSNHIPPLDESGKDPSFRVFRNRLLTAVARRDVGYLLSIVSADITDDFGGNGGRDEFRGMWKLDNPGSSGIWKVLDTVLRMGCIREPDGTFSAPYLFRGFPNGRESSTSIVAIRPNAPLRRNPESASPIVETLHWDILQSVDPNNVGETGWWQVRAPSGKIGYVRHEDVRSPIDYRAIFEKRGGCWLMIVFVAGA